MFIFDEDNGTKHEVPKAKEGILKEIYNYEDYDCDGDLVLDEERYSIAVGMVK